jgi:hypothetical protein
MIYRGSSKQARLAVAWATWDGSFAPSLPGGLPPPRYPGLIPGGLPPPKPLARTWGAAAPPTGGSRGGGSLPRMRRGVCGAAAPLPQGAPSLLHKHNPIGYSKIPTGGAPGLPRFCSSTGTRRSTLFLVAGSMNAIQLNRTSAPRAGLSKPVLGRLRPESHCEWTRNRSKALRDNKGTLKLGPTLSPCARGLAARSRSALPTHLYGIRKSFDVEE